MSSGWFHFACSMSATALPSHPARRALAARLVVEELHEVDRRLARLVLVGQHDNRRRADEAAVRLQRIEVERDVGLRRGQDASGGAAGQVGVELVTPSMPPQNSLISWKNRNTCGSEVNSRLSHAPGDRERAQALAAVAPRAANHCAPSRRSRAPSTPSPCCAPWSAGRRDLPAQRTGPQARHAALAFDRLDHGGFFAADIRARSSTQVDRRQGAWLFRLKLLQFPAQRAAARVFVPQVDPDLAHAEHQAATSIPSRKRCGSRSRYHRSLNVPARLRRCSPP